MMVSKLTRKRRTKCLFYASLCFFNDQDYLNAETFLTSLVDNFSSVETNLPHQYQVLAYGMRGQVYEKLNRRTEATNDFNRGVELTITEQITID